MRIFSISHILRLRGCGVRSLERCASESRL